MQSVRSFDLVEPGMGRKDRANHPESVGFRIRRWVGLVGIGFSAACGASSGEFDLLTYNVAGLPEGISSSHPEANTPLIGPLLNAYDVVAVQEDFTYHVELQVRTTHPYKSDPKVPTKPVNDGLNQFSQYAFRDFYREAWEDCHGALDSGSDCLSEKGFTRSILDLGDDRGVVLVNLHMDAGRDEADQTARSAQIDQLLRGLEGFDAYALIVAGDTNLKSEIAADSTNLERLLTSASLRDVCREVSCGDERIDRVLIRNGEDVQLTPTTWKIADEFVNEAGEDLSDHKGVAVHLEFE